MIGQPISRVDGPVKVTGRATYAYEYWQDEAPLYGVIVTPQSSHIREIDLSQAQRSQESMPSSPRTPRLRAPATSRRGGPQRRPGLNEAGRGVVITTMLQSSG